MTEWQRRIAWSVVVVIGLIIAFTLLYQWAMLAYEGISVTLADSLQVVIETLTTAGFGGDATYWDSTAVNLLVVGMNVTGVLLIFLALPVFVLPLFQEALQARPPQQTDLTGHVIICSYSPREDVLRAELEANDIPYVVIEEDADTVLDLTNDGMSAIYGDLSDEDTFEAANIEHARALVTDMSDERNVSIILSAVDVTDDLTVVSVADTAEAAVHHEHAGADSVIRPRHVLGRSLGSKAALSIRNEFTEIELGEDFELSEILVKEDSDLAGQTLQESQLRERFGATVIGMWTNGEFVSNPIPDTRIDPHSILLVTGSHTALEQVNALTLAPDREESANVLVAGYGVVGKSVVETLTDQGISHTIVDATDGEDVDIVGDIADPDIREKLPLESARVVVLALDDDTAALYAAVTLEALAPGTEVFARVNSVANRKKLYQSGAEYVLALSTVTGRMLASVLLEDEHILTPETLFEIVETKAPRLRGQSLQEARIREQTGATVVAVRRDGRLHTNLDPDFRFQEGDDLIITGSDPAINEFMQIAK